MTVTPPSNAILRPSQRVSNIFQTFAEGGIPAVPISAKLGSTTSSTFSPSLSDESNVHQIEKNLTAPVTLTDDVFIEEPNSRRRNNSTTPTHEPPPPTPEIQHQSLPSTPIANNKKRKKSTF